MSDRTQNLFHCCHCSGLRFFHVLDIQCVYVTNLCFIRLLLSRVHWPHAEYTNETYYEQQCSLTAFSWTGPQGGETSYFFLYRRAFLSSAVPHGFAFIRVIKTRFETGFDIATRLSKFSPYVGPTILKFGFDSTKKEVTCLDTVTVSPNANSVRCVNALDAILAMLKEARLVRMALKTINHTTVFKVIPMLEDVDALLSLVLSVVIGTVNMSVRSPPA